MMKIICVIIVNSLMINCGTSAAVSTANQHAKSLHAQVSVVQPSFLSDTVSQTHLYGSYSAADSGSLLTATDSLTKGNIVSIHSTTPLNTALDIVYISSVSNAKLYTTNMYSPTQSIASVAATSSFIHLKSSGSNDIHVSTNIYSQSETTTTVSDSSSVHGLISLGSSDVVNTISANIISQISDAASFDSNSSQESMISDSTDTVYTTTFYSPSATGAVGTSSSVSHNLLTTRIHGDSMSSSSNTSRLSTNSSTQIYITRGIAPTTSSKYFQASVLSPYLNATPIIPTPAPPSLGRCGINGCCTDGLDQLSSHIHFKESDPAGFVLAEMKNIENVTFDVRVTSPSELAILLDGYFNISATGDVYSLVLNREIDLEDLYDRAAGHTDVHSFQLMVNCFESTYKGIVVPPRLVNVSVEDVDDCMPVFQNTKADTGCVIPMYMADTSEGYMGELAISPGRIQAVDGDVTAQHNITYRIMHAEPEDYDAYFYLNVMEGTVNKTRLMNGSDPNKYVLFIEAKEDSPQQKKRVAVLSIEVFAPPDSLTDAPQNAVNPAVRSSLQVLSALVLIGFAAGFVVIIHHRRKKGLTQVATSVDEERDLKIPKLAVYTSSSSSLNSTIPDIPVITSPSAILVQPAVEDQQRKGSLTIRKPLDTKSRPGWNAPPPRPRRYSYSPYTKKK